MPKMNFDALRPPQRRSIDESTFDSDYAKFDTQMPTFTGFSFEMVRTAIAEAFARNGVHAYVDNMDCKLDHDYGRRPSLGVGLRLKCVPMSHDERRKWEGTFTRREFGQEFYDAVTGANQEKTMKDANLFAAMNPNVIAVGVTFPSTTKVYHYKAPLSLNLQVGDKVLVNVGSDEAPEYKVVPVAEVMPDATTLGEREYKWIVQKVDTTEHDRLVAQEKNFGQAVLVMERSKKREEIKTELAARLGADTVSMLTQSFASPDPAPAMDEGAK